MNTDDVARLIVGEAHHRGYSRDEAIACLADAIQESSLRDNAVGGGGRWHGVYQQDASYPDRDHPGGNVRGFFDRLDDKRADDGASQDIWFNIFWLQQRPGESSAEDAYANGRKHYLTEIQSRIDEATELYDRLIEGKTVDVGWTGDPVWLEDVLRPVLGERLATLPGWRQRGHGDFADIRGVMIHHTGNSRESAESIAHGRPDLEGPLSNLHIAPDGTVTIVAVGVCWHAGAGSYPWLPTNYANQHTIGIECAWPDVAPGGGYDENQRWPDPQFESMLDTCAALVRKLGVGPDRVIAHREYAGRVQGKWDPGNVDMDQFRRWVAERVQILDDRDRKKL